MPVVNIRSALREKLGDEGCDDLVKLMDEALKKKQVSISDMGPALRKALGEAAEDAVWMINMAFKRA